MPAPIPPALLEREEPLKRLEYAWSLARKGKGRIVSLEGEAGIGKSSLALRFVDAQRSIARVYLGACENLATPEPLGPLRDVARDSQGRFSISAAGQFATFEGLLRLLTTSKEPALLALEDLHWADDATLDALRFLGRRIRAASVMILVTFRNDEPDSRERLASLWADLPRDARERIELEPLTAGAVAHLALRHGRVAGDIFTATGGNPFHVAEYLTYEGEGAPSSVQEVTLARAARLSPQARRTLDSASIFPRHIDEKTLRVLADDAEGHGVAECLASQMLIARDGALAFRHELARRTVLEALAPLRRRELHAGALAFLKKRPDARATEIAHHAEHAGAVSDTLHFSVRAAEEAGRLGAYREAVSHLSRAIKYGEALPNSDRSRLQEHKALAAHFCGDFAGAVTALEDAIAIYRSAGDYLGIGNTLRISGHVQWNLGDSYLAEQHLADAVKALSADPGSWQHAQALASQAQFDMLADRNSYAIARAEESLAQATVLGRWDICLLALTALHTARASTDLDANLPAIKDTIDEAGRRNELDALPRLYTNLTSVMAASRRHDGLLDAIDEGLAACAARDQGPLEAYIRGNRATALLDMGRLREALTEAEEVVCGPYPKVTVSLSAMLALSRARVRLGIPEGDVLEQVHRFPTSRRDLLWRAPIALADAEANWLDGSRPGAVERLLDVHDALVSVWSQTWHIGETALWLAILGRPPLLSAKALAELREPHRAHVEGRWRDAARLWDDCGCPYEQAIALSQEDEDTQREALVIFDRIGAAPAARNLRRRMREAGIRSVPSGPRAARRTDPAGLTRRQRDVLVLLGEGLANADIADRLGLSAKTVGHHVSAILAALEAPNRVAAARIARERGLVETN